MRKHAHRFKERYPWNALFYFSNDFLKCLLIVLTIKEYLLYVVKGSKHGRLIAFF